MSSGSNGLTLTTSGVRRRRRRLPLVLGATGGVVVALAIAAGALLLATRGDVPNGTTVGGVDLGGMSEADAHATLRRGSAAALRRPIELHSANGVSEVTGALLGAQPRLPRAMAEATDVGLGGRLLATVGLGRERDLPLSYRISPRRLAEVAAELDVVLRVPAIDARVDIRGMEPVVTKSQTGVAVDRPQLSRLLSRLPAKVEVPLRTLAPLVPTAAAEEAAEQATLLLAANRFVGIGTTVVALSPGALARMLTFVPRKDRLAPELDPDALAQRLRRLQRLDVAARDARWVTNGKVARVVPAKDGRRVNIAAIGRSLVANLGSTVHRARFVPVTPAFTTEDAEKLGITELVSEFTTEHPCCAPRVTNIHLAADILDGTVLQPGEKFSLNVALGKRTTERGFVEAPQIFGGRLQDAIGGGVSQIATTLFNAAFFAGLRLDAHQAHQFYISRYPMGREATVSWGGPELIFTNTWPAGLLMRFLYTDTSITVQFYSDKLGRRVVTKTEEPFGHIAPRTYKTVNRALAPGETRVLQEAGPSGFTVAFTRKVFKDDVVLRNERYVVRYDAEHAYVEVGPKKKPPKKPKPGTPAQPPGAEPTPAPVDEVPNPELTPTPVGPPVVD